MTVGIGSSFVLHFIYLSLRYPGNKGKRRIRVNGWMDGWVDKKPALASFFFFMGLYISHFTSLCINCIQPFLFFFHHAMTRDHAYTSASLSSPMILPFLHGRLFHRHTCWVQLNMFSTIFKKICVYGQTTVKAKGYDINERHFTMA